MCQKQASNIENLSFVIRDHKRAISLQIISVNWLFYIVKSGYLLYLVPPSLPAPKRMVWIYPAKLKFLTLNKFC